MKSSFAKSLSVVAITAATFVTTSAQAATAPDITTLPSLRAGLPTPNRVATDASGRVYAVDSSAGRIVVIDAFNRVDSQFAGIAAPLGIAVDSAGNIYVGDVSAGSVSQFDSQWNLISQLGAGTNEFALPGYIAIDEYDGLTTVYVADSSRHQVKAYRAGALVGILGGLGSTNGKFNFPAGLWVSGAGELFVADQINDRVQVFDRAGAFVRAFTLAPPGVHGRSGRPQGITGDAAGRVFVADTFQGFIKAFDTNGAFLMDFADCGDAAGQLRSPSAVACDAQGRLFVASPNNSQVAAFGLDCYTQLIATPANQVAAVGSIATFGAPASCGSGVSYQWRKDGSDLTDGGVIAGATTVTLTLSGITTNDAGNYSVVVTGTNGVALSPNAKLIVTAAPIILASPASRTVPEGTNLTLTVNAAGQDLSYRWFFNGLELLVPDESSLVLSNIQASDAGKYWVVVTNTAGSATSAQATVNILLAPDILAAPISQTIAERGTAIFSVFASGSTPLSYQWFYGASPLAGKTSSTLTITNVTPAANGSYYVRASNSAGTADSAAATLTVIPDTTAPVALSADGGYATNRTVLLMFSKALNSASAQNAARYQIVGPGGLTVSSATLTGGTNVVLTLSGPRTEGANYQVTIQDVADTSYTPNVINPNPTTLSLASTVELIGINSTPWKYLQVTNNVMDSQAWKAPAFNDSSWSNGFGIFYGNRSNSVYQPNPNPNITLPLIVSASDPNRTKAYTILNVFTNAGGTGAIRENTYYFRTAFVFNADTNGASMLLRSVIDDGCVIYLNGTEIQRTRLSSGTVNYSTLASSSGSQSWSPAFTSAATTLPLTGLQPGTNTLAIEVHQRQTNDTDVTMGLLLEASVKTFPIAPRTPPTPLAITLATPGAETVIEVSWDESYYVLETATDVNGSWTEVTGATSPLQIPKAVSDNTPAQFFRCREK